MDKPSPRINEEAGMTLIEILFSMAVFAVGILGISYVQITCILGISQSIKLTNATQLASQITEQIVSMNYNHPCLVDDDNDEASGLDDYPSSDEPYHNNPIKCGSTGEGYNIYWNIAENCPIPNTKTIRVIVAWMERNHNREYMIDTIKRMQDPK